MAAKKASTYLTGGGGFNFEDAIAAYYLVTMLSQRLPFGNGFGALTKIKWQGSDEGWELDDLVFSGEASFEAGMSIKSETHLKTTGFSEDFAQRCWRQFHGTTGRSFDVGGEVLCLAVGTISADVNRTWQLLSRQAQTTSLDRLEERLKEPEKEEGSQSSQLQRDIVQSLVDHAPDNETRTMHDALALLKHIRVLPFDFLGTPSQMEDLAIHACQFLVESGSRADAEALWIELLTVAKENRQTGGDLTRNDLLQRIRTGHNLTTLPNYSPHLDRWHQLSAERLRHAKWEIAGTLPPLQRLELWDSWGTAIGNRNPIVIVGDTGAGKTSLVNEHAARSRRRLYLLDNTLTTPGGALHGGELSGSTYRLSELLSAEARPSVLLVDSVENMSAEDLDSVCSLLVSVKHLAADGHLEIVVSCQPTAFDRLRGAIARDGIACTFLAIPNPTNDEIKDCANCDSRLAKLVEQDRLVSLFTNLKVLDLALRAAEGGIAIGDQGHLKQTGVLDFLWSQWVENQGQSLVRGSLLQQLGIQDSEKLSSGHVVRDLEAGEIEYLPGLFEDGLLSKFEERVYFAHGFVADLSRMRVLLSCDLHQVVERAENFQWHSAIKLFAQHLAEDSVNRWLTAIRDLHQQSRNSPRVCDALFIDGLIAASEVAPELLSEVWVELPAISSHFVGLLLERLPIVGTRPDEHWRSSLSSEIVSHAGPWRTCSGQSLAAALRILVNCGELSTELVPNVIVICEMVLRRHVVIGDVPVQTSRDAAELACRIARCLVTQTDSRREYRGCREDIYRSMLVAAAVNPAEVTELTLYAAQRRALPEEETRNDLAGGDAGIPELESVPHGLLDSLFDSQETADPWPDGPLDRVDGSFQKVCLETDALIPLIEVDPAIAKEVLLACCIEEPQSRGHRGWGSDDEIGIVERVSRRQPLFDVGPFLPLFRTASNEAVDIMLHLCNFATEQWYESPARRRLEDSEGAWMGRRLGPFEMSVPSRDGTSAVWRGSSNIYRWSLGGLPPSRIITNILMAFEYWVYEQIAKDQDVTDCLARIVSQGRSAGLAGCLIDIGKRHPQLFLGPLMPLLGCWVFYGWDRVVQVERSSVHEGLIGWGLFEAPERRAIAVEWHRAEHRKRDLLEIARFLFIRHSDFREFMESSRCSWKHDIDGAGQHHGLHQLACVFDWANYSIRETEDNQQEIVYQPPETLTRQAMEELHHANEQQLLLTFPFQCRQLLDDGATLNQDQVDGIWQSVQTILNLTEEQDADGPFSEGNWSRKPDSISAAAAALIRLGDDFLTEEMDAFCRSYFEGLLSAEPERRPFDVAESVGNHSWDFFLADMTVEYLVRDQTDEAARWGVQRCITAFHYGALAHFMKLACAERSRLGDLFPLLTNYVVSWSALREQLRRVHSELSQYEHWNANAELQTNRSDLTPTLECLRREAEKLDREFQGLSSAIAAWQPVEATWESQIEHSVEYLQSATQSTGVCLFHEPRADDHDDSVEHADVGLDQFVLQHGFEWIDVSTANNDPEFAAWVAHLDGLLVVQRRMIPDLSTDQHFASYGYAHKFDLSLHQLVAKNIIRACDKDQSALWQAKLSQVSVSPDQVKEFLDLLCATVHDEQPEPSSFVAVWISMLGFATGSPVWTPQSGSPTAAWSSLLGMNFEGIDTNWAKSIADELSAHEDVVRNSFEIALKNPSSAASLVSAGRNEIWSSLRLRLLEIFASSIGHYGDAFFPAERICRFLQVCWDENSSQLATSQELDAAFSGLLSKAIHCGCRAALLLAEKIESSKCQR